MNSTPALSKRHGLSKKLIMGVATLTASTIVGTVGTVHATPSMDKVEKPGKNSEFCKDKKFMFKDYKQCLEKWATDKHIPKDKIPELKPPKLIGYDGGGDTSVDTNTNVDASATVEGDNNVVQFFVSVYNTINIFN